MLTQNIDQKSIFDIIDNLIVVFDNEGNAEYVNPAAKSILGYSPQELLGNNWWDKIVRPDEDVLSLKKQFLEHSRSVFASKNIERKMMAFDGEVKYILWNVANNGQNRIIAIGQDITELKKMQLENQKQKEELIESLEYAKNLQEAIFPDLNMLKRKGINDVFLFFRPRDIVSGDFYWTACKDDNIYLSVIDCTGHGVPGAMMSVLANGLLKEIIVKKGIENLSEVLYLLDEELIAELGKKSAKKAKSDGMDLAVIKYNTMSKTIEFAGANRPLFLVRNGELTEFKGSPFPIGYFYDIPKKFASIKFNIQENDRLYLFTDGYPDQFGGENDKKFSKKKFKELVQSVQKMNLSEQKAFLDYAFDNWKQSTPQTDDVTVVGVSF
jgi:PAS domain S-box-containing protein